ncbi:GNAT family N-acetyltransferase [Flexivirga alba]|uniref:GNAT family N-acetyltransferase n=1 Tax=Flexivirga alba TaxID=702742 RepID=A0ABW2AHA3_9MICO
MTDRRLERLREEHNVATFRSGQGALDNWLHNHAQAAQQIDSARTFVLIQGEDVVGYFSLTMGSVLRADAPRRLARGLPAYPVGVVLLARLAVESDHQGEGLGGLLLAESLRKAVAAGDAAAARLVVVDAIDEAAAHFYTHYGFLSVPEHPMRLYRRTKDIRASLRPDANFPQ